MVGVEAQTVTLKDVTEDMTALLVLKVDSSPLGFDP